MNLEAELAQFTGSETCYKINPFTPNLRASEGVKYLCEKAGCYWLTDIICSYQKTPKVKLEEFQVWKLEVEGTKAKVTCEDGDSNVLVTQNIPFTDFPLKEITIWLTNDMLFLPSEN